MLCVYLGCVCCQHSLECLIYCYLPRAWTWHSTTCMQPAMRGKSGSKGALLCLFSGTMAGEGLTERFMHQHSENTSQRKEPGQPGENLPTGTFLKESSDVKVRGMENQAKPGFA